VIEYLGAISSTCSVWRDTAPGIPLLWQRIIYKDHSNYPLPKPNGPVIPRHTKDRLLAYLSRSKSCGILLHLTFGASSFRTEAMKKIIYPHLPRCLSISLSFKLQRNKLDFLPLPGNLCRLTEFTCVIHQNLWDLEGCSPLPIFSEPEKVSLRKLILNQSCFSLDGIDLEDVRLTQRYNSWRGSADFISRCHSLATLTTLIIPYSPEHFAPFTLPNLIYLDTAGLALLTAAHTPNLQTLVLTGVYGKGFDGTVVRLPSWPSSRDVLCYARAREFRENHKPLGIDPSIKRLLLSECGGIRDLFRLLKGDNLGGGDPRHDLVTSHESATSVRLVRSGYGWNPLVVNTLISLRYALNTVQEMDMDHATSMPMN